MNTAFEPFGANKTGNEILDTSYTYIINNLYR